MNLHDLDASTTMAHRQAALALLALPPADRAWLLARLPSAERERLGALQEEVRSLGIPVDPAMARALVGAPLSANADCPDDALDRASPQQLALLLEAEPVGLVVSIALTQGDAARRALLDALSPARRRQVEDGLRSRVQPGTSDLAPALGANLRRVLAARLRVAEAHAPTRVARENILARAGRSLRIALDGWRGGR